jgi:hypothetical protein
MGQFDKRVRAPLFRSARVIQERSAQRLDGRSDHSPALGIEEAVKNDHAVGGRRKAQSSPFVLAQLRGELAIGIGRMSQPPTDKAEFLWRQSRRGIDQGRRREGSCPVADLS